MNVTTLTNEQQAIVDWMMDCLPDDDFCMDNGVILMDLLVQYTEQNTHYELDDILVSSNYLYEMITSQGTPALWCVDDDNS